VRRGNGLKRKTPLRSKKLDRPNPVPFVSKKFGTAFGGGDVMPIRSVRRSRRSKKQATPAEKAHMDSVSALGCIVCRHLGKKSRASIHHIRTGYRTGQRASNWEVLPLCPEHHQHGPMGTAFHAGPRTWMAKFGTEVALLKEVYELIGSDFERICTLIGKVPAWWPFYLDGSALESNAAQLFIEESHELHAENQGTEDPDIAASW
jgi:hypothetical protein